MTTTERATLDAMQKYGGSFIKALAACYIAADPSNRKIIQEAWSYYWQQYAAIAEDTEKARAQ
jgi:pyruvate/2-oxoacid:ferredoxin oxidoreductase beta subunit